MRLPVGGLPDCLRSALTKFTSVKRALADRSMNRHSNRSCRDFSNTSRAQKMLATTRAFGLLVHDNNQTVARRHTELMRRFHREGTLWTRIDRLIETPLFVDSGLTRMVQVADLCAYALRRYLENHETALFARIFQRAHRIQNRVVGVRHFTNTSCACEICRAHRPVAQAAVSTPGNSPVADGPP